MNNSFSSAASSNARITAKKIDMQCQQYLPPLTRGLEYYVLEDKSVQPITERYYHYESYTLLYIIHNTCDVMCDED